MKNGDQFTMKIVTLMDIIIDLYTTEYTNAYDTMNDRLILVQSNESHW